jgi:uncharacterized protein (TIGR02231 family)
LERDEEEFGKGGKMKRALFSFMICLAVCSFSSRINAEEVKVDSKITEVTVYPDSAAVSRRASLQLKAGEHSIIFSDIIPEIDENSLRASISPGARATLLGAQLKRRYQQEESSPRVQELMTKIEELEDKVGELNDLKSVFSQKKKFIDSISLFSEEQLPKELTTKMPDMRGLEEVLKFIDSNLKDIYTKETAVDIEIREISKKIATLRAQLNQISTPARKLTREIVVDLEVLEAAKLEVDISYLAPAASWRPTYDARVDFDKSLVELVSYGIIKQNTGEDWSNVKISLSTARATAGGSMPQVNPWFIRQYQPPARSKSELMPSASFGVSQKKDQDRVMAAPMPAYATAEERGIAVVYNIGRLVTVKADGSEQKFPVSAQKLPANFHYSAYPRSLPRAFLRSKVSNAKDLQLLSGAVNIFLEGDFVGSSSLGDIGPGEEFDLYLGMDKNVKVKKEQIEKKVDDILFGGIPSPNVKTTIKYKLTVENYKNKPIKAAIFDSLPVSQDERIKVKIADVTIDPAEKDWEDKPGVWRWELGLAAGKKIEVFYTVIVEHSRNIRVEGI